MPKTSNSKDCISVGGTTLTKRQLINRIVSFENKMSKAKLSEFKEQLKEMNCRALLKMLSPPRKSIKKPAAKAIHMKAAKSKTIAGAALESLPANIAKQLVSTELFMKWAKAAGSKPVNTASSKKKKANHSESESESESDSDLESDSE